jgi:shikimate dehydrogenase
LNATEQIPTGNAKLILSLAARPGKFGVTVHNAGYQALGLNYFYKALKIDDIGAALAGVRALGIHGCSISMPFKKTAIPFLDKLDSVAQRIGAVNTVFNDKGCLTGYNTDALGVKESLAPHKISSTDSIVVLGVGGVARAIAVTLKDLGLSNIIFCARDKNTREEFGTYFGVKTAKWESREFLRGNILMNATPIGMAPNEKDIPVSEKTIDGYRMIFDVVATPMESRLIEISRKKDLIGIDGFTMTLHQAAAQYKIYTDHEPPIEAMRKAALPLYK